MIKNLFNRKWKKRLTSLFERRAPLTALEFKKKMILKGYNDVSVDVVYNKISTYLPSSIELNIYPNDNILEDYDIDDEDLGDLLMEVSKELNFKFPSIARQKEFHKIYGSSYTIERLIQFVEYFQKPL